jgi:hypothetical protein
MGYAFITPEGMIRQTFRKLSPFDRVPDGDSIALYNPPNYDAEVEDLILTEPVITEEVIVEVVPKPREITDPIWQTRKSDVIQRHLDATAQGYGYTNIFTATTYATSASTRFGPEGIAFRDWRDQVWIYGYQVLADVKADLRVMPSDEELLTELPPFPGVNYPLIRR